MSYHEIYLYDNDVTQKINVITSLPTEELIYYQTTQDKFAGAYNIKRLKLAAQAELLSRGMVPTSLLRVAPGAAAASAADEEITPKCNLENVEDIQELVKFRDPPAPGNEEEHEADIAERTAILLYGDPDACQDGFDRFSHQEIDVFGQSNFPINDELLRGVRTERVAIMQEVFADIKHTEIFKTRKFGVIFRGWDNTIEKASDFANKPLNRFTSTSAERVYVDNWAISNGAELAVGRAPNPGVFVSTIIILPGTSSIVPLLLCDQFPEKRRQYELLLPPDGILVDTGYADTAGYQIFVYKPPEIELRSLNDIYEYEHNETNVLGFILTVLEGTKSAFLGGFKRRKITKRGNKRRTKHKKQRNKTRKY